MPSFRFLFVVACGLLAICAGYATLVLYSATWAEARALDHIFPFYSWHIRPFGADEFVALRRYLTWGATLLAGLAAILLAFPDNHRELWELGPELRQTRRALASGLRRLSSTQRQHALGIFIVLTALRLYFSIANPEYDDAVSYEVFVSKGLLATSAYYPIPNNHVFSNTISLLFYQLNPGFWWSMRLPVFLISTGATVFWFVALVRRAGYRVAVVSTTLFSWLQLSLYHAGVGRGYWLLIFLAGIVFFSVLLLGEARGKRRAAWAGLVVAGTLGCYTVPTFVYVLASAVTWLGWKWLRQRQWARLGHLIVAGSTIGLASALLYAPLLLLSGFDKFVGNGYVASLTPAEFWAGLPAYLWHTEGFLAGQRTLGALITLPVLVLVAWLFYLRHTGRLHAEQAKRLHKLGTQALWFMVMPYAVLIAQRVFAPERVMLYKAIFFFILMGMVVDWALQRWPAPAHRWPRRALLVLAVLFAAYETYSVVRVNPGARTTNAAYHAGLRWLATRPPAPILIPEPTHNLFFRFYAHSEMRQRNWQIDDTQQDTTRYSYVVAFPNKRGFFQPVFPFAPAYHNAEVDIYEVPPGYPLATQTWRH